VKNVNVYYARSNIRSVYAAQAAAFGLKKIGERVRLIECRDFKKVDSDYAVHYGFADKLRDVYNAYREKSTVVYMDLGYWQRRIRTRYDGYYKIVVNGRHPTPYFQNRRHSDDRLKALGVAIREWRKDGEAIIIAGLSEKAARAEGLEHQTWERQAYATIKRHTDRPIIYRPKPNCSRSRPIKGALYDKKSTPEQLFSKAHVVVARHSNMAVEALCAGIPVFVDAGVALPLSSQNLVHVESPRYPKGRRQWASDVAWTQFKLDEIKSGLPFVHLKEEGLIP
jgi:hypothetical protein